VRPIAEGFFALLVLFSLAILRLITRVVAAETGRWNCQNGAAQTIAPE
jgi:hypothetical protein